MIQVLSPTETGERLRIARSRARRGSRELSEALGQNKQFISRIEKGQRKRVGRDEWAAIASELAGRGDLESASDFEVLQYLQGDLDWVVVLRPRPLLADDDETAAENSSYPELTLITGSNHERRNLAVAA